MMRRKLGSKGFTLVELLIGVLILAVIVVPLATAFLTSQKSANKAKEIRSQTLSATNIIEAYKATDIGALLDAFKKSSAGTAKLGSAGTVSAILAYNSETGTYDTVTSSSKEDSDGPGYQIKLTGVSAGSKVYDAILYLDAATKYAQTNSALIVDYKPMDLVYIQPDPDNDKEADSNPDIIAAKLFAANAQIDSGNTVESDYFRNSMERQITITIHKTPSGGEKDVISCHVVFQYTASYEWDTTDNSTKTPITVHHKSDYSTAIPNDPPGKSGAGGLYFFYYPLSAGQSDKIDILNMENVTLSLYLIRQSAANVGSQPVITLTETNHGSGQPPLLTMHYNKADYTYLYRQSSNGTMWKEPMRYF